MIRKIASVTVGAAAALALTAGPAVAHRNSSVDNAPQAQERQGGVPFEDFVGPTPAQVGQTTYETAHNGMECGALSNPNIGSLAVLGFECPSPMK